MPSGHIMPRLFGRGSWGEVRRIGDILRTETVGGALLVAAAVVALVWANSPWSDTYRALSGLRIGPSALHLDLTLAQWAADGLLAVFFFVAGLELKREFVAGDLRDPRQAALPVAAAVGGMVAPVLVYLGVNAGFSDGALTGWAVPTATDIAFALAVLAVISTHLPATLRIFLLTLAVVDDLLAIMIIALFYTGSLRLLPLVLVLVLVPLSVRVAGAAPGAVVVAAAAAGCGHVGAGPRIGGARHGRRGAARVHRPHRLPRPRSRTGAGRALRASLAADLGRGRGAGVRVLRRWCRHR